MVQPETAAASEASCSTQSAKGVHKTALEVVTVSALQAADKEVIVVPLPIYLSAHINT